MPAKPIKNPESFEIDCEDAMGGTAVPVGIAPVVPVINYLLRFRPGCAIDFQRMEVGEETLGTVAEEMLLELDERKEQNGYSHDGYPNCSEDAEQHCSKTHGSLYTQGSLNEEREDAGSFAALRMTTKKAKAIRYSVFGFVPARDEGFIDSLLLLIACSCVALLRGNA